MSRERGRVPGGNGGRLGRGERWIGTGEAGVVTEGEGGMLFAAAGPSTPHANGEEKSHAIEARWAEPPAARRLRFPLPDEEVAYPNVPDRPGSSLIWPSIDDRVEDVDELVTACTFNVAVAGAGPSVPAFVFSFIPSGTGAARPSDTVLFDASKVASRVEGTTWATWIDGPVSGADSDDSGTS